MDFALKKDILYNRIKDEILSGKLKAGQKLPKGLDYAKELGASYITLRRALENLEKDGYIALVHGKGTFICDKPGTAKKCFLVLHEPEQDLTYPYHYILPGIERTAMSMDIDIETCSTGSIANLDHAELSSILKKKEISGIIIITSTFIGDEKILEVMRGHNIPVVLTHGIRMDYEVTGWALITYDAENAWRKALQHLIDSGHRRIMTLAQLSYKNEIRGYSYEEYNKLLKSAGAEESIALVSLVNFTPEAIQDAVEKAFQHKAPPTAILCFSDFWAPHVYKALKGMDLRIPEDVAVMGFCGWPDGEYMNPPLSTVDLEYFNIGKKSIELLCDAPNWFRQGSAPPLIYSDYHLKTRKSTALKIFEPLIQGVIQ